MSTVRLVPVRGRWGFTITGSQELELATAPHGATFVRADRLPVGALVRHMGVLHRVAMIAEDDGTVRRLVHRTPAEHEAQHDLASLETSVDP